MTSPDNTQCRQVRGRPSSERTTAANAVSAPHDEGSYPQADDRDALIPFQTELAETDDLRGNVHDKVVEGNRKKGTTDMRSGTLYWQDPEDNQWIPAIIHDDIRGELIAEAQAAHPGRRYAHPDPGSGRLHDETSFKVEHEGWGPNRNDRPNICFQWEKDENQVHRAHPGYMMHRGLLVLGPNDKPIMDWPEIPATLSTKTPGYKLEAMRRQNMDIKQADFLARMPRVFYELYKKQRVPVALHDVNTMINMPLLRFRATAGCLSWTSRDGTSGLKSGLQRMFAKRHFDPVANGNSTRHFRDLLPFEQEQVKAENADGKYKKQAGDRKISSEKQAGLQKKKEARWARAEEGYQRQLAENANAGKERKLEGDNEDGDESEVTQPAERTRRPTPNVGRKTTGRRGSVIQQSKADNEMSEPRVASSPRPFKKSKGLLHKAINNNAAQHRAKGDAAPIFDADSSDDDVPLMVRRKAEVEPAPPTAISDSEDSDTPLISRKRRRDLLAVSQSSPNHEKTAGANTTTKRKRPEVDADGDDDTDYNPRSRKRHRQAAPVIESDSDSDSDPDPIVVNPRTRRQRAAAPLEQNAPASSEMVESEGETYAHGTATYSNVISRLQRVNKRMREDLKDSFRGDDAPPAKRQCIAQESTNATRETDIAQGTQRKTRRLRRRSQDHPSPGCADKAAKVISFLPSVDLNPLQTAPTSVRYYSQVAEALKPTIDVYLDVTGYEAPPTNRWDSYATQWRRIYNSFKFTWEMITDQKVPALVRLSPRSQLHPISREYCAAQVDE